MTFVDTHTHLYVEQYDDDRDEVIGRALAAGIDRMYLPNIDESSIEGMLALEASLPGHCFAMMGLHPCSVGPDYREQLGKVRYWLDKRSFAAIGEIGMDLYWDKTYEQEQREVFLIQTEWAKEAGLPIVIHSREATDKLIELLRSVADDKLRGIFHCFTGTVAQAEAIIDLGFFLGVGGVLTFKNAGLDKTMEAVPLDRVVLETDSPYLAPAPFRGKRNESAYLIKVAEKLAAVKETDLETIAEVTTRNADAVFSYGK